MRLNFGNDTELYLVAEALGCEITDLHVAVATVGDKLGDVVRYIRKRQSCTTTDSFEIEDSAPPMAA